MKTHDSMDKYLQCEITTEAYLCARGFVASTMKFCQAEVVDFYTFVEKTFPADVTQCFVKIIQHT